MGSARASALVFIALCLRRGGWSWRLATLDINSYGLNGISGVSETDVIFCSRSFLFLSGWVQFCHVTTLTPAAFENHCTAIVEEMLDDAVLTLCHVTSHRPLGVTVPI